MKQIWSRYEDNIAFNKHVFIKINNDVRRRLTGGTYCAYKHINIKERIKQQKFNLAIMMRRVQSSAFRSVCEHGSADGMILVTARNLRKPSRHWGSYHNNELQNKRWLYTFCLWVCLCFILLSCSTSLSHIIFLLLLLIRLVMRNNNCRTRMHFTSPETNMTGKIGWQTNRRMYCAI